jgi:hypothetical protein
MVWRCFIDKISMLCFKQASFPPFLLSLFPGNQLNRGLQQDFYLEFSFPGLIFCVVVIKAEWEEWTAAMKGLGGGVARARRAIFCPRNRFEAGATTGRR